MGLRIFIKKYFVLVAFIPLHGVTPFVLKWGLQWLDLSNVPSLSGFLACTLTSIL